MKPPLTTTDNNVGSCRLERKEDVENLRPIADQDIKTLSKNNPDLLIFPHDLKQYGDEIGEKNIFSLHRERGALPAYSLVTGNIMGFVGRNDTQISIRSRFTETGEDYFLHYLLQKVFSINLFDLEHHTAQESVFDFLLYLFPHYLKRALRQGVYKEYRKEKYNDAHVRGAIDLPRQIGKNIPFMGRIAYRVREHSYDNKITQLIRHTIEFISRHPAAGILNADADTQGAVAAIRQATPSYEHRKKTTVIHQNLKPFNHPYFYEYRDLQKICLQILRYEELKYGQEKDKIYGLLFDGAWLWEEYLHALLKKVGFGHSRNQGEDEKNPIYLFTDEEGRKKGRRYPDFWRGDIKHQKFDCVLDAKYKRLADGDQDRVDRNDMHQIISYMYITQAPLGGFICPRAEKHEQELQPLRPRILGSLNGYGTIDGGTVWVWALPIPQNQSNFRRFCDRMGAIEKIMMDGIKNFRSASKLNHPAIPVND